MTCGRIIYNMKAPIPYYVAVSTPATQERLTGAAHSGSHRLRVHVHEGSEPRKAELPCCCALEPLTSTYSRQTMQAKPSRMKKAWKYQ